MLFLGTGIPMPKDAAVKFTFEKNIVGIWGNPLGLKYLAQLFTALAENPKAIDHIHLDRTVSDNSLITKDSLIAFIAILKEKIQK